MYKGRVVIILAEVHNPGLEEVLQEVVVVPEDDNYLIAICSYYFVQDSERNTYQWPLCFWHRFSHGVYI